MNYQDIQPEQLAALLAAGELTIFDTRDAASHARAHLEGAEPVSDDALRRLIQSRQRQRPILVYCYRGNSSRDVCQLIAGMGFTRVYNLAGGWQAWEAFLTTTPPQARPSSGLAAWLAHQGFAPESLHDRDADGMTPLMRAALQGERPWVEELLALGADPNHVNHDLHHALWFACVHGNPDLVSLLIEKGGDVDNQNVNGATCAIYAASTGKLEILKRLVATGADLSLETSGGYNALESAATLPVLRYLRGLTPDRSRLSAA